MNKRWIFYCLFFITILNNTVNAQGETYQVAWSNEVILPYENVGFPNLSPDGSQLIFIRFKEISPVPDYGEIVTIKSDGTELNTLVSKANIALTSPIFSPNGNKIAFLKMSGFELWKMRSDGSNQVRLTEKKYEKMSPVWWPDGSKITFDKWGSNPSGIYMIDFVNNSEVPFSTPELGGPLTFSPDGKTLLLLNEQDLIFLNIDGSVKNKITVNVELNGNEEPIWTPNGKYIILGNRLYELSTGQILPFLPENIVRYTETNKSDLIGPYSISLSKDGKKIAFIMEEPNSTSYRARIKIMDLMW